MKGSPLGTRPSIIATKRSYSKNLEDYFVKPLPHSICAKFDVRGTFTMENEHFSLFLEEMATFTRQKEK